MADDGTQHPAPMQDHLGRSAFGQCSAPDCPHQARLVYDGGPEAYGSPPIALCQLCQGQIALLDAAASATPLQTADTQEGSGGGGTFPHQSGDGAPREGNWYSSTNTTTCPGKKQPGNKRPSMGPHVSVRCSLCYH